jgi:hypothetical protein
MSSEVTGEAAILPRFWVQRDHLLWERASGNVGVQVVSVSFAASPPYCAACPVPRAEASGPN